eukprot:729675-Pleurochrysis_carterae.AAC.2
MCEACEMPFDKACRERSPATSTSKGFDRNLPLKPGIAPAHVANLSSSRERRAPSRAGIC